MFTYQIEIVLKLSLIYIFYSLFLFFPFCWNSCLAQPEHGLVNGMIKTFQFTFFFFHSAFVRYREVADFLSFLLLSFRTALPNLWGLVAQWEKEGDWATQVVDRCTHVCVQLNLHKLSCACICMCASSLLMQVVLHAPRPPQPTTPVAQLQIGHGLVVRRGPGEDPWFRAYLYPSNLFMMNAWKSFRFYSRNLIM